MANRGGLSLSVKMILTTTLLIVVTVVGSGVLNVMNIRRAFDESARQQIEVFRSGREASGDFGTPLFARAVQQLRALGHHHVTGGAHRDDEAIAHQHRATLDRRGIGCRVDPGPGEGQFARPSGRPGPRPHHRRGHGEAKDLCPHCCVPVREKYHRAVWQT